MLKSTATPLTPEAPVITFPMLVCRANDPGDETIILATGPGSLPEKFSGVAVRSGLQQLGFTSDGFSRNAWKPFYGTVTLTQEP